MIIVYECREFRVRDEDEIVNVLLKIIKTINSTPMEIGHMILLLIYYYNQSLSRYEEINQFLKSRLFA